MRSAARRALARGFRLPKDNEWAFQVLHALLIVLTAQHKATNLHPLIHVPRPHKQSSD